MSYQEKLLHPKWQKKKAEIPDFEIALRTFLKKEMENYYQSKKN